MTKRKHETGLVVIEPAAVGNIECNSISTETDYRDLYRLYWRIRAKYTIGRCVERLMKYLMEVDCVSEWIGSRIKCSSHSRIHISHRDHNIAILNPRPEAQSDNHQSKYKNMQFRAGAW